MSDRALEKQAQRWMASMMRLWEPLGRLPRTEAERAALGLDAGLERDWAPGTRLELIQAATSRKGDDPTRPGARRIRRFAFYTLGCRDWPLDLLTRDSVWLLPCQLCWSWSGIDLSNGGLPEGLGINDLPTGQKEHRPPPKRAAGARVPRGEEEVQSLAKTAA